MAHWNGRVWSRPVPLTLLNSIANDRGPAFSPDGEYLYFVSNREDGEGGYDLYVTRRDGNGWSVPEPLGEDVNTEKDELGPAISSDGKRLFFSSNRSGESTDIFVAERLADPVDPDDPQVKDPTAMPRFSGAKPVGDLNSEAEDVQAALTRRGDHVFLASDRERDSESGFSLYLSRVVDGKELAPEKIDLYFEKGEATDPAIRMEGFDLLFSRNLEAEATAGEEGSENYRLYRSTTREVFSFVDRSRWDQFMGLLGNIIWWILLAIAALAALIYILEHWNDITDLYHKCLAGSIAAHLIALLLMMIWLISMLIYKKNQLVIFKLALPLIL